MELQRVPVSGEKKANLMPTSTALPESIVVYRLGVGVLSTFFEIHAVGKAS